MGEILKGEFELERSLGRGATAQVHLARSLNLLFAERVALKVFHPGLWDRDDLRKRVLSEFKTVSSLNHPNIVKVLRAYWDWDPPVVAMEYVDGESLETFQSRLPYILPEISVLILIDVLRALEYAHEKGVIHRDLKPANILIGKSCAVVTDFGLAKATDMTRLTLSGTILGSPDFMAPEQARGDVSSPISDLFSVAAIGYFLMTGTRPFSRHSPLATLAAVCDASVEPPSRRNPKLSARLSAILMRGLSKDASARFASATQFRDALEDYLNRLDLKPEFFNLAAFLRTPNECVLEAMKCASQALINRATEALASKNWDAGLSALAHLGLIAPESAALERLMSEYERNRELERKKKRRVPFLILGTLVVIGILAGTWIFFKKPTAVVSAPEKPVLQAEPVSIPAPPIRTPSTSIAKPVKRATNGRIVWDIPADIQVHWDGRLIQSPDDLKSASIGRHRIRFEKPGFAPIDQVIKVNAEEPTVIRVR